MNKKAFPILKIESTLAVETQSESFIWKMLLASDQKVKMSLYDYEQTITLGKEL